MSDRLQVVADSLASLSQEANGGDVQPIVTRFYCVVETMDAAGERGIEAFFSDDLALWDRIGMLEFELTVERGKVQTGPDDTV